MFDVLTVTDLIMLSLGVIFLILWTVLFFLGTKENAFFEPLIEKEFPLKELYVVGYAALSLIGYTYHTKSDRKLRQKLEIVYTPKYCDYYLRVIRSQQITITLLLLVISFALYGLAADILVFCVSLLFAGCALFYFGNAPAEIIRKKSEELLSDFSEVVSKLALLTNAGLILREAWEEVGNSGDRAIYQEMQKSLEEMNSGVSEIDAIYNFGVRCVVPEIKKFTATIVQGMSKGNSELVVMLQQQSKELWEMKRQMVQRAGAAAATKLLIPISIMFIGILLIIIVPIFANIGV